MDEIKPKSLYFGFGSNLWLDQMKRRCPGSTFIGSASLKDWKWIINNRGYANVIPSKGHTVYGLMYELTPDDERLLDGFEGVPNSYIKRILPVDFVAEDENGKSETISRVVDALVYVDEKRVTESKPVKEYIHRMNMGITDGIKKGIPKEYFDQNLRPFIPEELSN
ncbi:Butirosin biosynthesis, BtrG-like protein [Collybia nuda]|uniref:gamma-glutamylcyclotransferase n=1 Tax=Collybia nuda TaxID=64659 RepID=A0A9P6CPK0_9AGAR|nr:Butirosin biosynthesis, BtrG-like protein [Collybia nuda]